MIKQVDYVIVGQGLAGTFLAHQLMQQKKSFILIDKGLKNSSSIIAAGIINPLVLKRLTITWRASEFLDYNSSFYNSLEQVLKKQYHFPLPIDKLISSKEEESFWRHRYEKEDISPYIEKELRVYSQDNNFKVGRVKQTSWLNIKALLNDFRKLLIKDSALIEEDFDFKQLSETSYKSIHYKNIVFCEGSNLTKNQFFSNLPLSLNKGQVLTIESDQIKTVNILKKKVFVLPVKENVFKVGATYSWKWESEDPEKEKTTILKEQLSEIVSEPYLVLKEEAGVRPTARDRRPLMGQHFTEKKIFIFNGMGSKACFMAPLLSKEMIDFIEKGIPLKKEMDIKRFEKELS